MVGSPIEDEIKGHPCKQEQPGEQQGVDAQQDKHPDDAHPSGTLEQEEQRRGHNEGEGDGEHQGSFLTKSL
jgi:hypothetical protein